MIQINRKLTKFVYVRGPYCRLLRNFVDFLHIIRLMFANKIFIAKIYRAQMENISLSESNFSCFFFSTLDGHARHNNAKKLRCIINMNLRPNVEMYMRRSNERKKHLSILRAYVHLFDLFARTTILFRFLLGEFVYHNHPKEKKTPFTISIVDRIRANSSSGEFFSLGLLFFECVYNLTSTITLENME